MTEYLDVAGGRIAYEVTGEGPLVVLAHGMGDTRHAYRFLVPPLVAAGYRVAAVDLRGHGESSTGWPSYTRTDTAADLLALIRELGGPAVIVGHSFAGGSATIAAADAPELVRAIAEVDPFTLVPKLSLGAFVTNRRYRRGGLRLIGTALTGSVGVWMSYLRVAFPGPRPADYAEAMAALAANLRGRWAGPSRPTRPPSWAASGAPPWCSWARSIRTGPPRRPKGTGSSRGCRPAWAAWCWSTAPGTTRTPSSRTRSWPPCCRS
jgi:pimeloyl-ACP methyl ester carboxylesterase